MPAAPRQSSMREHGVLLLGVVSSAALVVAAFLPANDPETVARTALAQLAARTEQTVVDEWQRGLRDPAPIALASSEILSCSPGSVSFPRVENQVGEWLVMGTQGGATAEALVDSDDAAGGALLAEAERLEFLGTDDQTAVDLVDEALTKRLSVSQRVRAALCAIRLAARAGDAERVQRALAALAEPDIVRSNAFLHDAPTAERLLQAVLAADPFVVGGARTVLDTFRPVVYWTWALETDRVARIERIETPCTWYSVTGLEDVHALTHRLRSLRSAMPGSIGETVESVIDQVPFVLAQPALDDMLGRAPVLPEPPFEWALTPVRGDFFAARTDAKGFFVTRDDLGARIIERLRSGELLPEGMELDFAGDREALGVALRPRVELQGREFAFTLRHKDPEALVRAQSRRQSWLRAALFVMAAFAAGAGFAMARALRRERKLAELKTTFIANVSHELRTPLASILLMAENLESGRTRDPDAARRYHGLIRRETLRLARLVDDVLDFSRLERGKRLDVRREDVDPRAVVEEWSTEFRAWAAEHAMELDLEVHELPASVSIDRDALRRALFNLLDNARKHSGSKRVRFEARGAQDAFLLRVVDAGIGIPRKERASVFEPFERLREGGDAAPGTGLGLAIVKEIVLAHGGTIDVRDPEHGHGAAFELRLPCSRDGEENG